MKKELLDFKKSMQEKETKYQYMLLGRLQQDCEYYLGNGGKSPRNLWATDEHKHIAYMFILWDMLEVKPEWLTLEKINEYSEQMTNGIINYSRIFRIVYVKYQGGKHVVNLREEA